MQAAQNAMRFVGPTRPFSARGSSSSSCMKSVLCFKVTLKITCGVCVNAGGGGSWEQRVYETTSAQNPR